MAEGTGRFDYLDGIRALAIAAVVALHWLSWYSPFLHGGSIGVDMFFVLSGFIITTMLWRRHEDVSVASAWWRFLRRRVARLYPALLGLVLASVLLYALVPSAPLDADEVARRGVPVLGQASAFWAAAQEGSFWVPDLHPFGQTWSLAIEWYFYLLWPLAVLGARARGWGARRLALVTIGAALPLYLASLPLESFWFYFGPTARFAELMAGAALALWFQAHGVSNSHGRVAAAAPAVALVAVAVYTLVGPGAQSPVYRYLGVPLSVIATLVLIRSGYTEQPGRVHRLLSHRWTATLGRHSYSLYLWHLVPLLLLEEASMLSRPVAGLMVVALTGLLTVASYRLVERPFLRPRSDVLRPPDLTKPVRGQVSTS